MGASAGSRLGVARARACVCVWCFHHLTCTACVCCGQGYYTHAPAPSASRKSTGHAGWGWWCWRHGLDGIHRRHQGWAAHACAGRVRCYAAGKLGTTRYVHYGCRRKRRWRWVWGPRRSTTATGTCVLPRTLTRRRPLVTHSLVCHHADAGVGAAHEVWHEAHRVWWRDCVACAWFAAHHDRATHRRGEGGVHSHGTLSIRRCGKRRQGQSSGGGGAAREACGVRWHLLHLLGGAPTPPSRPRHATPCPSAGATRESRPAAALG